jgi:hypothetical protein
MKKAIVAFAPVGHAAAPHLGCRRRVKLGNRSNMTGKRTPFDPAP